MNFSGRVSPLFQHEVIHHLCCRLDQFQREEDRQQLIHCMNMAVDRSSPVNRNIHNAIKEVEGLPCLLTM